MWGDVHRLDYDQHNRFVFYKHKCNSRLAVMYSLKLKVISLFENKCKHCSILVQLWLWNLLLWLISISYSSSFYTTILCMLSLMLEFFFLSSLFLSLYFNLVIPLLWGGAYVSKYVKWWIVVLLLLWNAWLYCELLAGHVLMLSEITSSLVPLSKQTWIMCHLTTAISSPKHFLAAFSPISWTPYIIIPSVSSNMLRVTKKVFQAIIFSPNNAEKGCSASRCFTSMISIQFNFSWGMLNSMRNMHPFEPILHGMRSKQEG